MTGRLVDMSFSLNRKQRITLEVDSDFRSLWDKLNQEPQQMGFATRSQRQQWQGADDRPGNVQVEPSFSQGNADDFSVIDDADDLPF